MRPSTSALFLIPIRRITAREKSRRLFEIDLLHEQTFFPVGKVGLKLAIGRNERGGRFWILERVVHAGKIDGVLTRAHEHRLLIVGRVCGAPFLDLDALLVVSRVLGMKNNLGTARRGPAHGFGVAPALSL